MEQFKTLDDLRDYVKQLGKFCARSVISGEHPTLYLDHSQGRMVQVGWGQVLHFTSG